jgi:hypothetical protein
MFWALAAIMLVFAGFTVLVVARRPAPLHSKGDDPLEPPQGVTRAEIEGHALHPQGDNPREPPQGVTHARIEGPAPEPGSRGIDRDQLKGFVYVGAGALALLAVAVIVIGLVRAPDGRAESLAVLGFFGYAAYLIAATVVLYAISRKS